jgi:hypothetical protein
VNVYDLYIVEDAADAAECERHGVFDFVIGATECENCAMAIGPLDDVFVPCAIIHDAELLLEAQSWPVCLDCVAPLIFPGLWLGLD